MTVAPDPDAPILTARLELRTLAPAFLAATRLEDRVGMERYLGAPPGPEWPGDAPVDVWEQRSRTPIGRRWSARAVILRATGTMIGHAGFHLPPGSEAIEPWAPGGVEIGYTIFQAHRRQGFATELARGLVEFAQAEGVPSILATTDVENVASRSVLTKCGFALVDQVAEGESTEDVWVLRLAERR